MSSTQTQWARLYCPRRRHHRYHYYPIVDYLRENPGSEYRLPADRLTTLEKASGDAPVEVRYTCHELRELIHETDCKGPITAYYRPVIDYARDSRLLGFSMLVVQNEPPCKDARQ